MEHLAILNKKVALIDKILTGEKSIESRWYKNKVRPWNKIKKGDVIYFKNSGELVIARATVSKVLQFEDLNLQKVEEIIQEFGDKIQFEERYKPSFLNWFKGKRFALLIFLKNPEKIKPFKINKKGYGFNTAWITVEKIDSIEL